MKNINNEEKQEENSVDEQEKRKIEKYKRIIDRTLKNNYEKTNDGLENLLKKALDKFQITSKQYKVLKKYIEEAIVLQSQNIEEQPEELENSLENKKEAEESLEDIKQKYIKRFHDTVLPYVRTLENSIKDSQQIKKMNQPSKAREEFAKRLNVQQIRTPKTIALNKADYEKTSGIIKKSKTYNGSMIDLKSDEYYSKGEAK